jgi:hypothetical protein
MKKVLFWSTLLLGLFFTIGTAVTVLSYTAQIADKITLENIPYVLLGIILDFVTNPAGWLGITLLVVALILKKKIKNK